MRSFGKPGVMNLEKLKFGISLRQWIPKGYAEVWVETGIAEQGLPAYPSKNFSAHHSTSYVTLQASMERYATNGGESHWDDDRLMI
ncbi:uncharacterized protein Bfra_009630 [Botrytis fragariae]|uniref:Uncharacterized protein n=1 Tax=Botrytis fragariae TaxID=1964551 RepID=A0A8H6AMD8_9HELO|nr:uncharacterized protein Bfra_009630 [Botrytis fragariae]KAF5870247.1 hypothetical protein Bfra_009630 [Botrytis fragariae]